MQRLIDAMVDELRVLRLSVDVNITHLSGSANVAADRLSRLCSEIQPLLEGDGDTTADRFNLKELLELSRHPDMDSGTEMQVLDDEQSLFQLDTPGDTLIDLDSVRLLAHYPHQEYASTRIR
jgi:hypothetical protein